MKRLLFVLLMATTILSCQKEGGLASIGITVVNPAGIPIQNCNVLLSVPVENSSQFYGITDEDGFIEFKSGLDAYYDLTVWKGLWKGCDYFVRFSPGESNTTTIVIYPPNNVLNGCIQ